MSPFEELTLFERIRIGGPGAEGILATRYKIDPDAAAVPIVDVMLNRNQIGIRATT